MLRKCTPIVAAVMILLIGTHDLHAFIFGCWRRSRCCYNPCYVEVHCVTSTVVKKSTKKHHRKKTGSTIVPTSPGIHTQQGSVDILPKHTHQVPVPGSGGPTITIQPPTGPASTKPVPPMPMPRKSNRSPDVVFPRDVQRPTTQPKPKMRPVPAAKARTIPAASEHFIPVPSTVPTSIPDQPDLLQPQEGREQSIPEERQPSLLEEFEAEEAEKQEAEKQEAEEDEIFDNEPPPGSPASLEAKTELDNLLGDGSMLSNPIAKSDCKLDNAILVSTPRVPVDISTYLGSSRKYLIALESGHIADMREWTDSTGKFSTMGALVIASNDWVRIYKENGNFSTFPVRRLSDVDKEYIKPHITVWSDDGVRLAQKKYDSRIEEQNKIKEILAAKEWVQKVGQLIVNNIQN